MFRVSWKLHWKCSFSDRVKMWNLLITSFGLSSTLWCSWLSILENPWTRLSATIVNVSLLLFLLSFYVFHNLSYTKYLTLSCFSGIIQIFKRFEFQFNDKRNTVGLSQLYYPWPRRKKISDFHSDFPFLKSIGLYGLSYSFHYECR